MNLEKQLTQEFLNCINNCYGTQIEEKAVQVQKTKLEFSGEYTFVVFPLLKISKKSPVETAQELGESFLKNSEIVTDFNVVKGFLNLNIDPKIWLKTLINLDTSKHLVNKDAQNIMVEYSSPNTNKPLHLGHIRNNFLGYSVSEILKAAGHNVIKTQIINDRGIHICKSMLAWKKYATKRLTSISWHTFSWTIGSTNKPTRRPV